MLGSCGHAAFWQVICLHPVFGPGEDRNTATVAAEPHQAAALHPVFGPGEDRNADPGTVAAVGAALHPVFGPGEDRNGSASDCRGSAPLAAPGLRTG